MTTDQPTPGGRRSRRERLKRREELAGAEDAPRPAAAPAETRPAAANLRGDLAGAAERPRYRYLSDAKIEVLKAKAIDLLATHGVFVNHAAMVAKLKAAGASVGQDGIRVHIPAGLVADALAETPKTTTLYSKAGRHDLELPRADGTFHMRTGTGAHGYIDPETGGHCKLTLDDARTMARLADKLPEIGFIAHPFVNGVPELTSDIHGFAAVAGLSEKHNWIQPYNAENVEYLLRIAAIAAGGEDALRARPVASCIACSFTPLEFKRMDVEAIMQSARAGIPIHACALPTAGGTAPITMPATVLMAAAEILAMVVMAHVAGPATPVIATPLIFALDVRTGRSLQSSAEALSGATMAIQLMKQGFGLMAHTYGAGSDTPDIDGQSQAERALIMNQVALSGADVLGGVGQLECATVFSPTQAVIDNELGAMMRHYLSVPAVDDDTLAWRQMLDVELGGHFLADEHTLTHCRDNLDPGVFLRLARDAYEDAGRPHALDAARDTVRALLAERIGDGAPTEDQRAAMAEVVAAADKHILKDR